MAAIRSVRRQIFPGGTLSGELIELPVNGSVGLPANYSTKRLVVVLVREAPVSKKKNEEENDSKTTAIKKKTYERELRKLQTKLVEMQEWVRSSGSKVVVVFEGRDAAGKGGVIHRIMERVSPRVFHHVALPAPTDREKSQLYAQRYMKELPAAGEVVLFDRSWYNRALVEHVMGFCTDKQYAEFLRMIPGFAWGQVPRCSSSSRSCRRAGTNSCSNRRSCWRKAGWSRNGTSW